MSHSNEISRSIRSIRSCCICAAILATPVPALAQEDGNAETPEDLVISKAKEESVFEFSYAAPGSPVLPLLGVTGDQITRSESFRKFGIGILSGLGGGASVPGIAFDFSPYWLTSSQAMSLAQYRDKTSAVDRILIRTKFGLAAGFGDKATGRPSSFVASFSTNLLDSHDALSDDTFSKCVKNSELPGIIRAIHEADDSQAAEAKGKGYEGTAPFRAALAKLKKERPEAIEKAYSECATQAGKALAARPSLDVGAGIRYRGLAGRLKQLDRSGAIVWGTFATGVFGQNKVQETRAGPLTGIRARGVLHARYTFKDDVLDDKFVLQGKRNSAMLVAGLESAPHLDPQKIERYRWNLQAGWNRQSAVLPTEEDKNYWRYQAILNVRISDGLWANGTLGRVSGKGIKTDTKAVFGFTFSPPSKASKLTEFYSARDR